MATVAVVPQTFGLNTGVTPVGTAVDTSSTFTVTPSKGRAVLILVDNTGTVAASTVTFIAANPAASTTAGANPGVNVQGGIGNLASAVGTSGEHKIWFVLEPARFLDATGTSYSMTFAGFSAGKVYAFELPRSV
jgi:hypothetical protein